MTANDITPFAAHYPARPAGELAGLLRDLAGHPDRYGRGDTAALIRAAADRMDNLAGPTEDVLARPDAAEALAFVLAQPEGGLSCGCGTRHWSCGFGAEDND
jgi:hypothetical protein